MNAPKTKSQEIKSLHPTMTVVPAKLCMEMEDALRAIMDTPVPHAPGCSHERNTCTCHRNKALKALDMDEEYKKPDNK